MINCFSGYHFFDSDQFIRKVGVIIISVCHFFPVAMKLMSIECGLSDSSMNKFPTFDDSTNFRMDIA